MSALDDYHFPWLHKDVLGDRSRPLAPERAYEMNATQLITRFETEQPANVTNSIKKGAEISKVRYTMRVDVPNVLTLIKENIDGGVYVVWFAAKAERYDKSPVFWKVIRNYEDSDDEIIKMEKMIQAQDIDLVASQRPWLSPPLPIKGVDGAFVKYLQMLKSHSIPINI